jgi:hypothetical protein
VHEKDVGLVLVVEEAEEEAEVAEVVITVHEKKDQLAEEILIQQILIQQIQQKRNLNEHLLPSVIGIAGLKLTQI